LALRLDIDTVGPLPKDDYENEYVVIIVELTPVKSTSGLNAESCPRMIHSDRGMQFLNDMITGLVTEGFAAFQRVTMVSTKDENAIVERAHKEVNCHLRAFVFDVASSVRQSFVYR
jgi:hypothetical protein